MSNIQKQTDTASELSDSNVPSSSAPVSTLKTTVKNAHSPKDISGVNAKASERVNTGQAPVPSLGTAAPVTIRRRNAGGNPKESQNSPSSSEAPPSSSATVLKKFVKGGTAASESSEAEQYLVNTSISDILLDAVVAEFGESAAEFIAGVSSPEKFRAFLAFGDYIANNLEQFKTSYAERVTDEEAEFVPSPYASLNLVVRKMSIITKAPETQLNFRPVGDAVIAQGDAAVYYSDPSFYGFIPDLVRIQGVKKSVVPAIDIHATLAAAFYYSTGTDLKIDANVTRYGSAKFDFPEKISEHMEFECFDWDTHVGIVSSMKEGLFLKNGNEFLISSFAPAPVSKKFKEHIAMLDVSIKSLGVLFAVYRDMKSMMTDTQVPVSFSSAMLEKSRSFRSINVLKDLGKDVDFGPSFRTKSYSAMSKFLPAMLDVMPFMRCGAAFGHSDDNNWQVGLITAGFEIVKGNICSFVKYDEKTVPHKSSKCPARVPTIDPNYLPASIDADLVARWDKIVAARNTMLDKVDVEIAKWCPCDRNVRISDVFVPVGESDKYTGTIQSFQKSMYGTRTKGYWESLADAVEDGEIVVAKFNPLRKFVAGSQAMFDWEAFLSTYMMGKYMKPYGESRMHNGEVILALCSDCILEDMHEVTSDSIQQLSRVMQVRMHFANNARNWMLCYGLLTLNEKRPYQVFGLRFATEKIKRQFSIDVSNKAANVTDIVGFTKEKLNDRMQLEQEKLNRKEKRKTDKEQYQRENIVDPVSLEGSKRIDKSKALSKLEMAAARGAARRANQKKKESSNS